VASRVIPILTSFLLRHTRNREGTTDEFDKPIEATPPDNKLGIPGRRGAPLGILHVWKARLKQIKEEIEAARARPNYDPRSSVITRWIDDELKLEEEIANVERIREARRQQMATPADAAQPNSPKLERGRRCAQIVEEMKRFRYLRLDSCRTVKEIQTDCPNFYIWELRENLPGDDRELFDHPNQWGSVVTYAYGILGKHYAKSWTTIRDWVKAWNRSQGTSKQPSKRK
jgi:hypothetical protein